MPTTVEQTEYLRARDFKPGMRVKIGQLRYIYEVFILLSDVTHSNSYEEQTGIIQFVGKEITPEVSAGRHPDDWICYVMFFDERESFDLEELNLLDECSKL